MAEPAAAAAAAFDSPEIDPTFLDPGFFPDGDDLPHGLLPSSSSLDLDDIDLDFSIDDLILAPDDLDDGSLPPRPDPNDGSALSSASHPSAAAQNPSSPDSGNSHSSAASAVLNVGESPKRKKRKEEDDDGTGANPSFSNPNPRSSKFRRSEEVVVDSPSVSVFSTGGGGSEEDEKRKARLMRNRESAQLSRQRKKHYVEELEDKVRSMSSTIAELNSKISFFMAENANLRHQLSGNGNGNSAPPAAGGYPPVPSPMGPMHHFPWIPYPGGFPLRPNGSQVPLLPIPRLKPQQPAAAPKVKKSECKKGGSKTKKVASISLLGLLFVMLIFGGVVPGVDRRSNGDVVSGSGKVGLFSQSHGRVLTVRGRPSGLNRTDDLGLCNGKLDFGEGGNRVAGRRCRDGMVACGSNGSVPSQNSTESLPALLYVPRNGKHVKINGNLIIHSVLASERSVAQAKARNEAKKSSGKEGSDASMTVAAKASSALAISKPKREVGRHSNSYGSSVERQRALASDSEDVHNETLKSPPVDGPLQQWFREGLAGPIFSSGTCTEVLQFDVSPSANSGGIVPAASVGNDSQTSAHSRKIKNRRIMYPQPIPLPGSTFNNTEHFGKPSESNFHGNTSIPSMVVSVMADPREAGNGDSDGMVAPKSLSRIFVVVLMDSVKYVTYSCMLPLKSHAPHLVN